MKNVLIVEDNIIMAEAMKQIVMNIGADINVLIAHDSETAYAMAMGNNISLMLIDIALDTKVSGDVSGMKFAKNIRTVERYKFIPIIMVTSLEDPKLYAYSEIHCYGYIEKPYDADYVEKLIRETLQYNNSYEKNTKYIYRNEGIFYNIDLEEVVFVEYNKKRLYVHSRSEEFSIPYVPLGKLLQEFDNDDFIQINRNCIINKKYIEYADFTNRFIKMKGVLRQIEIGATLRKNLLAQLKND